MHAACPPRPPARTDHWCEAFPACLPAALETPCPAPAHRRRRRPPSRPQSPHPATASAFSLPLCGPCGTSASCATRSVPSRTKTSTLRPAQRLRRRYQAWGNTSFGGINGGLRRPRAPPLDPGRGSAPAPRSDRASRGQGLSVMFGVASKTAGGQTTTSGSLDAVFVGAAISPPANAGRTRRTDLQPLLTLPFHSFISEAASFLHSFIFFCSGIFRNRKRAKSSPRPFLLQTYSSSLALDSSKNFSSLRFTRCRALSMDLTCLPSLSAIS